MSKRSNKIRFLMRLLEIESEADLLNYLQEHGQVSDNAVTVDDVAECDLDTVIDTMD